MKIKDISDDEKNLAWQLGKLNYKFDKSITANPFKKTKQHYFWWKLGYEESLNEVPEKNTYFKYDYLPHREML